MISYQINDTDIKCFRNGRLQCRLKTVKFLGTDDTEEIGLESTIKNILEWKKREISILGTVNW